jgi:hypothetical protein
MFHPQRAKKGPLWICQFFKGLATGILYTEIMETVLVGGRGRGGGFSCKVAS